MPAQAAERRGFSAQWLNPTRTRYSGGSDGRAGHPRASTDITLGGQPVRAGQRVGLFYRSANFDEAVFGHPERFDILRSPNPHLGFGGSGAHFCLGANLARLEIELIFNAIADTLPAIQKAGEAQRLRSGWLNGIKRLPVTYQ